MKIIYLIAGTYRPAGMERVLSLKARYLADRGHEIVIVTTDQRGQEPVFGLGDFRQIDLGINYESTNGAPFWKKTLLYFPKHARHRRLLRKTLLEEKADIVVSMFNNDVDIVPSIKDGSRKVLEVHFSRFKKIQYARKGLWALADKWRTRSEVRAAARFDKFVTLTEEDKAYWEADYAAAGLKPNIVAIPNPRSFAGEAVPFSQKNTRTVLAVGRYTYQKGFDMLLDAWKQIIADPSAQGWRLRIAGDGEDRVALERQAAELGISDSVEFGPCADMKKQYSASDIVVMTSRFEGFGMVLAEAQACGVPMVAFACKCGPSEIITEGQDGFLVETGDISSLAQRTLALIGDSALRKSMGEAALRNSERFDMSRIMGRWEELFGRDFLLAVSAVNLRKGGTLTILRDCLKYLSDRIASGEKLKVVALVHKKELCDFPGIEYIEMPWCIKTWAHRLWAEYVTIHSISARLAQENGGPVDLWLSLHDTTPNVIAKRQEVYCHTSFPFLKIIPRDWIMNPKIPIFAIMGRLYYRINVRRNDNIIVQQQWFASAMSRMLGLPLEKFRVIPPTSSISTPESVPSHTVGKAVTARREGEPYRFFYVSTPDCHKNFETLCEAARLLENEVGKGRFTLFLTLGGKENRYARWTYKKWGNVESIDFHGLMTREEVFGGYAAADCFVFPSRVETWGLPISEFIAANPDGKLLLADLPYAHETSAPAAANTEFFEPMNAVELKNKMKEKLDS